MKSFYLKQEQVSPFLMQYYIIEKKQIIIIQEDQKKNKIFILSIIKKFITVQFRNTDIQADITHL